MKKTLAAVLAWAAFQAAAQPATPPVTPPPIAARAFILVDALSGQTLAAAAENDRFEPASLTKLMAQYVIFGMIRDRKLDPAQSDRCRRGAKPRRREGSSTAAKPSRSRTAEGTLVHWATMPPSCAEAAAGTRKRLSS